MPSAVYQPDKLYDQLQKEFAKPVGKGEATARLLTQLKIHLAENSLLMPSSRQGPAPDREALRKARDVLEIGAFYSIRTQNVPAFERYISQLGPYYRDYHLLLPPSERRFPLIGLDLLRLLAQNKIAQFHTVLEGLVKESGKGNVDILHTNPYISHPVNLEQWLMEGSYSKVWGARSKVPMEEYRYFVDVLVETIRNEIASCEEKAYTTLPLSDAGTLLFFKSPKEVMEFAHTRGWSVDPRSGIITFPSATKGAGDLAKEKVIEATLSFARELETIV